MGKVDAAGGSATMLVAGQGEGGDLAVDDSSLYWGSADAIVAIDKASGAVITLAAAQGHPARLAADGSRVYWVNSGLPRMANAELAGVYAVAKKGGAVMRVATLSARTSAALAISSSHVYWADGTQLRRTPK